MNLFLGQPLVITLHDMNHFTGGCHYSDECYNFTDQCGNCPQLVISGNNDLSAQIFQRKFNAYQKLDPEKVFIAADSNWMRDSAIKSKLLGRFQVETVYFGLDVDNFKPKNKKVDKDFINHNCGGKNFVKDISLLNRFKKIIKLVFKERIVFFI